MQGDVSVVVAEVEAGHLVDLSRGSSALSIDGAGSIRGLCEEVGGCGCEVGSLFLRCLSRCLSLSVSCGGSWR